MSNPSWHHRLFRWFDRRAPRARAHLLQRDKLYIFPTITGFAFSGLIAVLWMLGTNYQNNVILGLALLLASLFILGILRTHANLSGLEIRFHDADAAYAQRELAFHLDLVNHTKRPKDAVRMAWEGQIPATLAIEAGERVRVPVCAFAKRRGYLQPGRLKVETVFPLGLLRCWSWLMLDARALVYPQPVKHEVLATQPVEGDQSAAAPVLGSDEFQGFREYRVGDPLKQVAWKQFARGQGLLSKEFESPQSTEVWLTWDASARLTVEQQLSNLCYWTLHHDELGGRYGLSIPGVRVEPGSGPEHRRKVLSALALYQHTQAPADG